MSQPSITRDGTLYFLGHTDGPLNGYGIYRAQFVNGRYLPPELLPHSINLPAFLNWTPFIAPDESYLLFSSNRAGGHDAFGDIYIAHRSSNGTWNTPILLDDSVNTPAQERFPAVSPDGRFLFFTRWTREHDQDVFVAETERLAAFNLVSTNGDTKTP